jgi:hypothetical protein
MCERCGSTRNVQAHHHKIPIAWGGSNDSDLNGETLCSLHHARVEAALRRRRSGT